MNTAVRTTAPLMEPNPLQRALNDYHMMEAELTRARVELQSVMIQSRGLVSEVEMLREALERADSDRIRLQAISSTLLGRLLAINDCIAGAVKASIKDGVEAAQEAKPDPELERAAAEVQSILQRVTPIAPTPLASEPEAAPEPPQIDWSRRELPHDPWTGKQ